MNQSMTLLESIKKHLSINVVWIRFVMERASIGLGENQPTHTNRKLLDRIEGFASGKQLIVIDNSGDVYRITVEKIAQGVPDEK